MKLSRGVIALLLFGFLSIVLLGLDNNSSNFVSRSVFTGKETIHCKQAEDSFLVTFIKATNIFEKISCIDSGVEIHYSNHKENRTYILEVVPSTYKPKKDEVISVSFHYRLIQENSAEFTKTSRFFESCIVEIDGEKTIINGSSAFPVLVDKEKNVGISCTLDDETVSSIFTVKPTK